MLETPLQLDCDEIFGGTSWWSGLKLNEVSRKSKIMDFFTIIQDWRTHPREKKTGIYLGDIFSTMFRMWRCTASVGLQKTTILVRSGQVWTMKTFQEKSQITDFYHDYQLMVARKYKMMDQDEPVFSV